MPLNDAQLTIGFEIEFASKRNHLWVRDYLITRGINLSESNQKKWLTKVDVTPPRAKYASKGGFIYGVELNTNPIELKCGTELPISWKPYFNALEKLKKSDLIQVNYNCGVHCHIQINNENLPISFYNLKLSGELDKVVEKFQKYPNNNRKKNWSRPGYTDNGDGTKYYTINPINYNRIEIRSFNGSIRYETFLRYFLQIKKSMSELFKDYTEA